MTQAFKTTHWTTSSNDDDCEIVVRCVGAIFYLCWSPDDLAAAPTVLEYYRKCLRELRDEDDFEGPGQGGRAAEKLKRPFDSLMAQLAPEPRAYTVSLLYDYLYPEWFWLKATLARDCQTIQPSRIEEAESPHCLPGIPMHSNQLINLELQSWVLNWYSSRDIELIAEGGRNPLLHGPSKIITTESRTKCFFKGFGPGSPGTSRELATLHAIQIALARGELPANTRVCRLHGLVVDKDASPNSRQRLVGMLLTSIKAKQPGILGTLQYIAQDDNSRKHLSRWADDLDDIVGALHRVGCIWGDAKPENVLVDENDDLWLIDFGGGYTVGWVDKRQQGTEDGDRNALRKIRKWLEKLSE